MNSIAPNLPIVESTEAVTLVAGGPVRRRDLVAAVRFAPRVVAADGGADRALAAGVRPEVVIGDMDSVSVAARAVLGDAVFRKIPEQDSTDFDKARRSIAAPMILALGCLGGRVDHELAVFSALVKGAGPPCLLIGATDVVFHAPRECVLTVAAGTRVSLFPMRAVTGQSEGLRWPIGDIEFAPDGRGGTSNEALGPVRMRMDGPGMLVILPRACLALAVSVLAGAG